MQRAGVLVVVCLLLVWLALNLAVPHVLPSVPIAKAMSRTIWLVGNQAGWNYSQPSGLNPTITVTEGDTITVNLSSSDIAHNFFVDVTGSEMWTCPPNAGCSAQFGLGSPKSVTFTVNFAPGTYQYLCSYHLVSMRGSFVVQPFPDFSLSSNPSSMIIDEGSANSSTISIVSGDSTSGNVSLTASVLPIGPTVGVNPGIVRFSSTVRSANANLTVTVPIGTNPALFTVTVVGNNGTIMHAALVQVTVPSPDFQLSPGSSTTALPRGSSTTMTITVTSIAGLSGTIDLSSQVSSAGVNATISPSSLIVASGSLATAELLLSAGSASIIGNYTITITGSGTSGQHSTNVIVTVGYPPVKTPVGGPSLGLAEWIAITSVGVLLVASTTVFLYRRGRPNRETPG